MLSSFSIHDLRQLGDGIGDAPRIIDIHAFMLPRGVVAINVTDPHAVGIDEAKPSGDGFNTPRRGKSSFRPVRHGENR